MTNDASMTVGSSYIKATSLEHALSLAQEHEGHFRYLAGGTDLLVNKFQGNADADLLIDLSGLTDLKQVRIIDSHMHIGSMVTLHAVEKHPLIAIHMPVLAVAAQSVATLTIRKTATLGGNLLCENRCIFYNQSEWWREAAGYCLKCKGETCLATGGTKNCFAKFVSDTAVALISLHAEIEVIAQGNSTILPLENIYSGDGINPLQLDSTAIITDIRIPMREGSRTAFRKLRKRESMDFTSLTTAVSVDKTENIRIVLGGVHAKPVIVDASQNENLKELIAKAVASSRAVDNDTFSRAYRREMISVFLNRSFNELGLNDNTESGIR